MKKGLIILSLISLIGSSSLFAKDALKDIISLSSESLEEISSPNKKNSWRLEYFTTDLAITIDGRFGIFAGRGSPSAQVYWRRQGIPSTRPIKDFDVTSYSGKSDQTTLDQIELSLSSLFEPYFNSEKKSAKEKNLWHDNVHQLATKTFEIIQSFEHISSEEEAPWRLTGLRFEYQISAGGQPLPFGSLGGEIRLRFDWKLRPKPNKHIISSSPIVETAQKMATAIQNNLLVMDKKLSTKQLRAYTFRVGLSIGLRGDIGIIRLANQANFHLVFSRNISRPVIYPKEISALTETKSSDGNFITSLQWQKCFERSIKIAEIISNAAKPLLKKKKWRPYIIKTGLDFNLNSNVGDYVLGGQLLSEISFYNMNF